MVGHHCSKLTDFIVLNHSYRASIIAYRHIRYSIIHCHGTEVVILYNTSQLRDMIYVVLYIRYMVSRKWMICARYLNYLFLSLYFSEWHYLRSMGPVSWLVLRNIIYPPLLTETVLAWPDILNGERALMKMKQREGPDKTHPQQLHRTWTTITLAGIPWWNLGDQVVVGKVRLCKLMCDVSKESG